MKAPESLARSLPGSTAAPRRTAARDTHKASQNEIENPYSSHDKSLFKSQNLRLAVALTVPGAW